MADNRRVLASSLNMHLERQQNAFCGVHAANALIGDRPGCHLPSPQAVVAFLRKYWPDMLHVEYDHSGWFSDGALTKYYGAHYFGEPIMFVHVWVNSEPILETSLSKENFLSFFPPDCDSILYNFTMPSNGRHFACIKKDIPSSTWYFLDSIEGFRVGNQPHAIAMKDSDWACLRGQFSVAAGIDPFLNAALGFVPRNLRRYDVPQHLPELRLTQLDQLRIQSTPQRLPLQPPGRQSSSAMAAAPKAMITAATIKTPPQRSNPQTSTHQYQERSPLSKTKSDEWTTISGWTNAPINETS